MMIRSFPNKKPIVDELWSECHQLTLIFGKITKTLREKDGGLVKAI